MSTKRYKPEQIIAVLLCKQAEISPTNESDPRFQDLLRRMNLPPQGRPQRVARPCFLHAPVM